MPRPRKYPVDRKQSTAVGEPAGNADATGHEPMLDAVNDNAANPFPFGNQYSEPGIISEHSDSSDEESMEVVGTGETMEVEAESVPPEIENVGDLHWPIQDETGIAQIVLFISTFTSLCFSLSRTSSMILLRLLKLLVVTTLRGDLSGDSADQVLVDIPRDPRTIRSRYDLGGETVEYAVCPRCHCLYPPGAGSRRPRYPELCSNTAEPPGTPCNEQLLDKYKKTPLKKFVHNSVKKFIASLLSEESTERHIDDSCDRLRRFSLLGRLPELSGPFDAEFLRDFRTHSHGSLFIERGDEARLAFSLAVDFFNVEGNRSGAASVSCGIISLACLNLPSEIRYKDEYMFLAGIIPGPKEVHCEEMHYYLRPLVDEFMELWNPGVHISRTALAPTGRLARAAIALVVCDLPAARKVSGLLSYNSKDFLCSRCQCPKELIGQVGTVFPLRESCNLRQQATYWRDATTNCQRRDITDKHGVRWSELWRLPYWDPAHQLVVDPMHCLLLGLVANHFTVVFPLLAKVSENPSKIAAYEYDFKQAPPPPNVVVIGGQECCLKESEVRAVSEIHKLLVKQINVNDIQVEKAKLNQRLEKKHRRSLIFVAESLGLNVSTSMEEDSRMKKQDYADALTLWRFERPLTSETCLSTIELIKHIQIVIANTSRPSFVRSVPSNFGTSSAGKIKADEWRTLCTIFLPLALISYCHYGGNIRDDEYRARFIEVLDHTMELIQAIKVLFKPSISRSDIVAYDMHIRSYITQLAEVHPDARFIPNMHMATHIKDYLPLFGSVYSWWTFPFERLIGKLQDMQTNGKIGQLEATMLDTFIALSQLRRRFPPDNCPPGIKACFATIDQVYEGQSDPIADPPWDGAMRINDELKSAAPPELVNILSKAPGTLFSRCRWKGVQYCARCRELGNSQIFFRTDGLKFPIPGFIECIIVSEPPVFIMSRLHLNRPSGDPFHKFEHAPMALYEVKPGQLYEAVEFAAVVGHFAALPVGPSHYAIVPLFSDIPLYVE